MRRYSPVTYLAIWLLMWTIILTAEALGWVVDLVRASKRAIARA